MEKNNANYLENREEYKSFFKNALAWKGALSIKVIPGVLLSISYTLLIWLIFNRFLGKEIETFISLEYFGVFIGLLLVFRINAGYSRWWEARTIWGSIVNQSRNLAIVGLTYSSAPPAWRKKFASHIALLPHAMRRFLRSERDTSEIIRLLGSDKLSHSNHWPNMVAIEIAKLLKEAKENNWLDEFEFYRAERERSVLIDDIGACERILKTPVPFVFAIKLKRFILFYLSILPIALIHKYGLGSLFIDGVVAYTLLSLDSLGFELQNPFYTTKFSHLPLDTICETIEKNVFEIESNSENKILKAA